MISTKKLVTAGTVAALFAATAMPAFANGSGVSIKQKNVGGNGNGIVVSSNTGDNKMKAGDDIKGGKIKTGDASTDNAKVVSSVNGNLAKVDTCECDVDWVKVKQKNYGGDNNLIVVDSNTGGNKMKAGDDIKHGKIKTGNASTDDAKVVSLVNTNIAKVN